MALGIAGYFKNRKVIGTLAALLGRFICHFISGVIFFGSFAPKGMSPAIYSLTLNGIFMSIEGAICIAIIVVLPVKHLETVINKKIMSN